MRRVSIGPSRVSLRTPDLGVVAALVWSGLLAIALWQYLGGVGSARGLAIGAVAVCGLGLFTISKLAPGGFWSPAGMFFLVVSLFHLGLAPYWILDILPPLGRASDAVWFLGEFGEIALRIVTLGLAAFMLGFVVVSLLRNPDLSGSGASAFDATSSTLLARCGSAMLMLGIGSWFAIVLSSGGVGLLLSPYQTFLEATAATPIPYVYSVIGVGLGLSAISMSDGFVKVGICVCLGFGVLAFLLGLRGEVLFPAAVAASVLSFQRRLPGPLATVGIATAGLLAVSIARQVRQFGVGGDGFETVSWDPMAGLAELGLTLRVVAAVAGWHYGRGEEYASGETYSVFFARAFEGLFGSAPPAQGDQRLFNIAIGTREGQIGGSVIGEALHNGGPLGVLLVMFTLGALFGYFSCARPSVTSLAVYVAIGVPLFNHVRNSFVPVVPAVAGALLIITLCFVFIRFTGRSSRES